MNVTDALAHLAEHRLREVDSAGRGSARGRHGGPAGASVLRASGNGAGLRPDKQRKLGRLHQADRTWARSPWVRSSSTRSSCPMWRQRWPPAACGARRARSTRSSTATATRCPFDQRAMRPGGARGTGQHARERAEQGRPGPRHRSGRRPARWVGTCRCRARPAPPSRIDRRDSSASPTVRGGELHLRRLQRIRPVSVHSRCASAAAATCTAATSPPAPGSRR